MRLILKVILLVIILNVVLPIHGLAHRPIFSNNKNITIEMAQEIPNANISHAIYGKLKENTSDFYRFSTDVPIEFYAEMTVPANDKDYSPSFRILDLKNFTLMGEGKNFSSTLPKQGT